MMKSKNGLGFEIKQSQQKCQRRFTLQSMANLAVVQYASFHEPCSLSCTPDISLQLYIVLRFTTCQDFAIFVAPSWVDVGRWNTPNWHWYVAILLYYCSSTLQNRTLASGSHVLHSAPSCSRRRGTKSCDFRCHRSQTSSLVSLDIKITATGAINCCRPSRQRCDINNSKGLCLWGVQEPKETSWGNDDQRHNIWRQNGRQGALVGHHHQQLMVPVIDH